MNRKTVLGALVITSLLGGFAGSAQADDNDAPRRICLMATDDPDKQGYEPVCVWIPGTSEGN